MNPEPSLTPEHIELLRRALPLMQSSVHIEFVADALMGVPVTSKRYDNEVHRQTQHHLDYWAARSIDVCLLGGESEFDTIQQVKDILDTISSTPLTT